MRLLPCLAVIAAPFVAAPALPADAAPPAPVVVELFTSQGCSSCPPADAFLTDLARQRPDVLPLAFHITYWNDLGWRDPFSLEAATARQRAYAKALGGDIYTPEMVVDGTTAFVGSDRPTGLAAIAHAAVKPVAMTLTAGPDTLTIAIGEGQGPARVLLLGFDRQHETPVGRGENGGRTLRESNIVRSLTTVADWSGTAVTLHAPRPAGEDAAVLLQTPDGRIIGAARLAG